MKSTDRNVARTDRIDAAISLSSALTVLWALSLLSLRQAHPVSICLSAAIGIVSLITIFMLVGDDGQRKIRLFGELAKAIAFSVVTIVNIMRLFAG